MHTLSPWTVLSPASTDRPAIVSVACCCLLRFEIVTSTACLVSASFPTIVVQDTSRRNDLISAKIDALKKLEDSPFRWYNGNVTTLLHSLKSGAD